jgi:hypothetical protein
VELEKVGMYLKSLNIKTERRGETETKVVVASLAIQPFTRELAEALVPGVKSKLFGNDGAPAEDMLDVVCGIHAPNYFAVRLFRAPDLKRPSVGPLSTVKMEPRLKVRRDKETPSFAALLKLNFPFPTAEELLFLAHNVNSQFWVSVAEEQGSLVEPPNERDEPKEDQPKLRAAK